MDPFIRLKTDGIVIAPETRLLKAADYQAFVQTRDLLAEAKEQAARHLAEAEQEYVRQQQLGYADGQRTAKLEMASQLIETAESTVDYLGKVEERIVTLVVSAVRRILDEFDDTELTLRVVRQALGVVRDQPRVTIHVALGQEAPVHARIKDLLAGFNALGVVEVVGDSRLGDGDSILETEIGVVDARLDLQLEALEKTLKARFERAA
jgi:type III secretion protein L